MLEPAELYAMSGGFTNEGMAASDVEQSSWRAMTVIVSLLKIS